MSLRVQNIVSLAIAATLAGIGVVMAGTPESFGLDAIVVRWLGVVVAVLGAMQTQLHQVTGPRLAGKEDPKPRRVGRHPKD